MFNLVLPSVFLFLLFSGVFRVIFDSRGLLYRLTKFFTDLLVLVGGEPVARVSFRFVEI